ncbi:MAG: translation initiation factor [Bacteroides sp.]|nr:translation initiation factor [Bacteroides sp.]
MDWKDALGSLLNDPTLPPGDDVPDAGSSEKKPAPNAGRLRLFKERKGRGGKTVIIVEGFSCNEEELSELAAWLKKKLGVGGSARNGEILVQGDCADKVRALLSEKGFRF